jgi:hypothetical protein
MPAVIPARATEFDILEFLVDTGNPLDGALLKLFKNDISPNRETVVGDFTAADFTGYAPSAALVWGAPYALPSGQPIVTAGSVLFQAGNPLTVPGLAYGWYMTNAGGTVLLASLRFAAPVGFALPDQGLEVIASYPVNWQ